MVDYQYLPLATRSSEFRLLRLRKGDTVKIEGEVFHAPISDHNSVSYEALSYAWGNTEAVNGIEIDGRKIWITESLYSALQCLRFQDRDRTLWIDAICINQADEEERSQQVLVMSKIFKFATSVIFWLGKPTSEATLLMQSLDKLQKTLRELQKEDLFHFREDSRVGNSNWETMWSAIEPDPNVRNDVTLTRLRKGLRVLLKRPWFERVWILQEVANARSAVVAAGSFSVSAEVFAQCPSLFNLTPEQHVQSVLDLMPRTTPAGYQEGRLAAAHEDRGRDYLINLLPKFSTCKATDGRDMIFSLLGMTLDPPGHRLLRPDYKISVLEVLQNAVKYWLELQTAVNDIFQCLSSCEAVYTTCLIPMTRQGMKTKMVQIPIWSEPIPFVDNASLFLLEKHQADLPMNQDAYYIEVDRIEQVLNSDLSRIRGSPERPLQIIPWQTSRHNLRFLIVKKAAEALLLAASNKCERLLCLIAEKGTDDKQEALYLALETAVRENRVQTAELLLRNGGDVNYSKHDTTPLHIASRRGHLEMVRLLLDNGADVHAQREWSGTPLHAAVNSGHLKIFQILLDHGADINIQDSQQQSPLHLASKDGCLDMVQLLLGNGADINAQSKRQGTALHTTIIARRLELSQFLLDHGADVNARKSRLGSPLYLASKLGRLEMVQLLLDNGAEINATSKWQSTALHGASKSGQLQIVQILLEKGADINAWERRRGSSLHAASRFGHFEIVQLLLDKGADVNAQAENYGSVLQAASLSSSLEVVQLLLRRGADVHAQGGRYGTALQAASFSGHLSTVQLLLRNGAAVNARGGKHGSALQAAIAPRRWESTRLEGDSLKVEFEGSKTAKVVQLLLEEGADFNVPGDRFDNMLEAVLISASKEIERAHTVLNTKPFRRQLKRKAKIDTREKRYELVLKTASAKDYLEMVQFLLDAGADVDVQGTKYGHLLKAASAMGYENIAQIMIDRGAETLEDTASSGEDTRPFEGSWLDDNVFWEDIDYIYSIRFTK